MKADPDLWKRIEAFALDEDEAELKFSKRLARENGWQIDFARRVIEEYKRFCYLAVVAGHEVTPSDEVDQAWHLHLVYTRNYWDEFCAKVLGKPLHHGPTKGGVKERRRYDENYVATVESYKREFGSYPPEDIWPHPDIRFGQSLMAHRVNTARNWVIPKPSSGLEFLVLAVALSGAAVVAHFIIDALLKLWDAYVRLYDAAMGVSELLAMALVAVSLVVAAGAAVLVSRAVVNYPDLAAERRRQKRRNDSGGGCAVAGGCGGCGGGAGAGGCGGGCGGGGCGGGG